MKVIEMLFSRKSTFRLTAEECQLLEIAKRIFRAKDKIELGVAQLDLDALLQK